MFGVDAARVVEGKLLFGEVFGDFVEFIFRQAAIVVDFFAQLREVDP